MSKQKPKMYINKILLNPQKYNIYSQMKPAGKDMNFFFKNSISFNLVENLAQFKNNEFSQNDLNIRLFGNLSFLFTKQKITTTKNNSKKKSKNVNINTINQNKIVNQKEINDFKILGEYECYVPTKRIPYFNKNNLNDKSITRKDSNKKIKKINNKESKIPSNLRNINFFRPEGRLFSINTVNMIKFKKKAALNITTTSDGHSEALSTSNTYYNTNYDDDNNSSENYSLLYGESNDNIFNEKIFSNILKVCPTFPKYSELGELIECPLEDAYSPEMRYNNFVKILDSFINDDDNNENYCDNNNNNNYNNNNVEENRSYSNKYLNNNILINLSQENSIININDINEDNYNNNNSVIQRVFIINPANYKPSKYKVQRTTSKSGKLIKVSNNMFNSFNSSMINKTSISDDNDLDDYKKDESLFAFFETEEDKKNPSKKIDSKIRRLLPKTANKYINEMNDQYIFLMNEKYKKISTKLDEAKKLISEKAMIKRLFVQLLKELLLDIGISSKKFYEKIIKFAQYSKEKITFEHFMNIFDIILNENNKENLRFKFLLLLKIIERNDSNDQIIDEKQINLFFDLIECECIYINKLCEILGEKLILRYKAIYSHESIDKSSERKYIYRKMKIILESFLCALDS